MTAEEDRSGAGTSAAIALRRRSSALRVLLMGVIALLIGTLGHWAYAGAWWALYVLAQSATLLTEARSDRWGNGPLYVASFMSFAVAGAPTWHLWTQAGVLGAAAATMFLCGMLAQLVTSSLAARRLFIASVAPLITYLVVVPPLAFGPGRPVEAAAILACALLFIGYLSILWRGQQAVFEAIEQSRVQAEAASRAKTEFVATMSHEIRTPMNAVLGAANLLCRTELSSDQKGHVAMLQDAGAVLMQILNDVLDLSKIEAGKLTIERTRVDLHAMVRRCANFWEPRITDAGLELRVEIAPETPRTVVIDPVRTGQILFNLLANALKFTAHGTITLALRTGPDDDETPSILLSVVDTGIGIAPDAMQRLFAPFEQADNSITRRFGGTGLGLAISRRLASMMDGDLTAQSVEGAGSTFQLRLRAAIAEEGQADSKLPGEPSGNDAGIDLRVLVAEDNPANQRIIEHFLRPISAHVTLVDNGLQAVEALEIAIYDVVLMDMQMPVMDGLEATRRVRASAGPNADVPIFALTANVMEAHRDACREAGMSGHIGKPIDARLLLSTVLNARAGRLGAGEDIVIEPAA